MLFSCIMDHSARISADIQAKSKTPTLSFSRRVLIQLLSSAHNSPVTKRAVPWAFHSSSSLFVPSLDPRIKSGYGHAISSKKVVTANLKVK